MSTKGKLFYKLKIITLNLVNVFLSYTDDKIYAIMCHYLQVFMDNLLYYLLCTHINQ